MEGPCNEIPKHCLSSLTIYFWRAHNGYKKGDHFSVPGLFTTSCCCCLGITKLDDLLQMKIFLKQKLNC
jgi:hypothetical protein